MVGALEPTILPGVPLRIANGRFRNAGSGVAGNSLQCFVVNPRQVWSVWDTGELCTEGREILIVFLFLFFFSFFPNAEKIEKQ